MTVPFDPANPVVALCAKGIATEGEPAIARALYEEAWARRTDDFDAAIAAHYLARLQETAERELHWCSVALAHGERIADERAHALLPSLLLNVGDARRRVNDVAGAHDAGLRAQRLLQQLPADGYRDLLAMGVERLLRRLASGE